MNKEEKRDFSLTELLSVDKYHVGSELYFREMPSRFSYYDTETKLSCRYKRYQIVVDFFKRMSFESSEFNLGPEYEQSFTLESIDGDEVLKYILRIRPNLFLNISAITKDGIASIDLFFDKSKILEFIKETSNDNYKEIIRNITIEQILL